MTWRDQLTSCDHRVFDEISTVSLLPRNVFTPTLDQSKLLRDKTTRVIRLVIAGSRDARNVIANPTCLCFAIVDSMLPEVKAFQGSAGINSRTGYTPARVTTASPACVPVVLHDGLEMSPLVIIHSIQIKETCRPSDWYCTAHYPVRELPIQLGSGHTTEMRWRPVMYEPPVFISDPKGHPRAAHRLPRIVLKLSVMLLSKASHRRDCPPSRVELLLIGSVARTLALDAVQTLRHVGGRPGSLDGSSYSLYRLIYALNGSEPLHQRVYSRPVDYVMGMGSRSRSSGSNMADEMDTGRPGEGWSCRQLSRSNCHRTPDLIPYSVDCASYPSNQFLSGANKFLIDKRFNEMSEGERQVDEIRQIYLSQHRHCPQKVPNDAAGRRVFSGISRFPHFRIPTELHAHFASPSSALNALPPNQSEQGSIPGRVAPGFSHVGIVPDDAAGRWVFSGISRFPPSLHSSAAPSHPINSVIPETADIAGKFSDSFGSKLAVTVFGSCFPRKFVIDRKRSGACLTNRASIEIAAPMHMLLTCPQMSSRHFRFDVFRPYCVFSSYKLVIPDVIQCGMLISSYEEGYHVMLNSEHVALEPYIAESNQRKAKRLCTEIDLGDKTPSYVLREMRNLAGDNIRDEFLRTMFLERMPVNVRAILSTNRDYLNTLATLADKIVEVNAPTFAFSCSAQPDNDDTGSLDTASAIHRPNDDAISRLTQQVAALGSSIEEIKSGTFQRGGKCGGSPLMAANVASRNSCHLFITDAHSGVRFLIDTGADISVLPPTSREKTNTDESKELYAAKGSITRTFGERLLKFDLGLNCSYVWPSVLADVRTPIIGASFLKHLNLLPDVSNRRLLDANTSSATTCPIAADSGIEELYTVPPGHSYPDLLKGFPP
ncbi:hypothetical protein PR048_027934 [Dryococelus australis]|uniref:Peptidase A2 domain-containing protein n=1 Tax=Dryococelus australis TaxID=614101 RepID=A0ABQ9GHU6_9NEOP|nr:hypothetical protein PR048_027934 [Dryococelus australis]